MEKTKIMPVNGRGFTLIELLVVISIIAFITVAAVVTFNIVRMNARDTLRAGNIATINKALAMYLNDSTIGYPQSAGECISNSSVVGQTLVSAKVIVNVPLDPLWPSAVPSNRDADGAVISPSSNFCYYYASNSPRYYYLSYYLESNSKAGDAGIHVTNP